MGHAPLHGAGGGSKRPVDRERLREEDVALPEGAGEGLGKVRPHSGRGSKPRIESRAPDKVGCRHPGGVGRNYAMMLSGDDGDGRLHPEA